MAQIYNDSYEKLEHFSYRRLNSYWKIGDEFVIPSKDELKDRLILKRIKKDDYEFELPYIQIHCTDGIERELSLNILRKYIVEYDDNCEITGKVYEPNTSLYRGFSQARNARELFDMLAQLSGYRVRVVNVFVVKTKCEYGVRKVVLPCFDIV